MSIGIIGSGKELEEDILKKAKTIGETIGIHSYGTAVSGACLGASYESILAAHKKSSYTVGFSPAHNYKEHIENYKFPIEGFDFIVYTGFGLKGRNVPFIRSCDGVIAIAGRVGTVTEMGIAYDEKKVLGILEGVGGSAEKLLDILYNSGKDGGEIILHKEPDELVHKVVEKIRTRKVDSCITCCKK